MPNWRNFQLYLWFRKELQEIWDMFICFTVAKASLKVRNFQFYLWFRKELQEIWDMFICFTVAKASLKVRNFQFYLWFRKELQEIWDMFICFTVAKASLKVSVPWLGDSNICPYNEYIYTVFGSRCIMCQRISCNAN